MVCIYHSKQWEQLVNAGWRTKYVEETAFGLIAFMFQEFNMIKRYIRYLENEEDGCLYLRQGDVIDVLLEALKKSDRKTRRVLTKAMQAIFTKEMDVDV